MLQYSIITKPDDKISKRSLKQLRFDSLSSSKFKLDASLRGSSGNRRVVNSKRKERKGRGHPWTRGAAMHSKYRVTGSSVTGEYKLIKSSNGAKAMKRRSNRIMPRNIQAYISSLHPSRDSLLKEKNKMKIGERIRPLKLRERLRKVQRDTRESGTRYNLRASTDRV